MNVWSRESTAEIIGPLDSFRTSNTPQWIQNMKIKTQSRNELLAKEIGAWKVGPVPQKSLDLILFVTSRKVLHLQKCLSGQI